MRATFAFVLSCLIALSGVILADARGANHDIGAEIVICSGVGMTTITIGPDGELIETKEPCPDGSSVFAAAFVLPDLPRPFERLVASVESPAPILHVARHELTPTARGPPVTT
ncbi:hypothetical protein [Maritimibacter sp. DP1N21-5]|uniref:hypothetical protein n=1 Tax=Maritimibacter sp. DP1N21-5 TaxID=2836867 RepID=UPI001C43BF2D|nr:hypothetical protein [Maritimibacter sp. DP1N21-5]MBV7408602.1 hypothetical protein [Maritimibacter sp. DP1N21-5]